MKFAEFEYKRLSFEEMKETASKLSEGLPFVRVDLYSIKGKIYFDMDGVKNM